MGKCCRWLVVQMNVKVPRKFATYIHGNHSLARSIQGDNYFCEHTQQDRQRNYYYQKMLKRM